MRAGRRRMGAIGGKWETLGRRFRTEKGAGRWLRSWTEPSKDSASSDSARWWWIRRGSPWRELSLRRPLAGRRPRRVAACGGATNGLWLAFRKLGYRAVIVKPAEELNVVMERAAPAPFPRCKEGAGTAFQLPLAAEGTPFHDVDYNGRTYTVKTNRGKHYLRHGHGPMWSNGLPSGLYLEQSTSYEESTFERRTEITAARGVFADGTRWRFLGTFGETITYHTKDEEAARRFDLMLDGVCLGR